MLRQAIVRLVVLDEDLKDEEVERLDDGWETATRLTFELTPRGDGCELSILQQDFEHLPLSRCLTIWEAYRRRWWKAVALLAQRI